MTSFKELAERAWQGELDTAFEHHPVHSAYDGAEEIADGVLMLKGIAAIYVVDSGDGLIMLDAGSQLDIERLHTAVREWRPNAPLKWVVFSHHHVDHIFGCQPFTEEAQQRGWPAPQVVAHELTPAHFDRYLATLGWNTVINRRQFAIHAPQFRWPESYRYPDVTYNRSWTTVVGNLTLELRHARGETDDHTWTWIPELRLLMPGDLFIWAMPNAGNPQKVQRYVSDWATALRDMAALEPELLLPGHGFPIFGKDRVTTALTDTADLLDQIETQTLAAMNRGLSLDAVCQAIDYPQNLLAKPYLLPVYDDVRFLVRMIWRRYGGWWDGEYDRLLPAPRQTEAAAWVALSGGIETLIDAALERLETEPEVSSHLIETAYHAEPDNSAVHDARAKIYRHRAQQQTASMARNIFNHAALASDAGRRDLASDT